MYAFFVYTVPERPLLSGGEDVKNIGSTLAKKVMSFSQLGMIFLTALVRIIIIISYPVVYTSIYSILQPSTN